MFVQVYKNTQNGFKVQIMGWTIWYNISKETLKCKSKPEFNVDFWRLYVEVWRHRYDTKRDR